MTTAKEKNQMKKNIFMLIASLICFGSLYAKNENSTKVIRKSAIEQRVFLYGESHSEYYSVEYELKEWKKYYSEQNMRHLFIENSYSATQLLNQWMHEEDDEILLQLYDDWDGTLAHSEIMLNFYREIKRTCPETVFHGTDIGHQYMTNGKRYLQQLEEEGLKDSEEYRITEEINRQAFEFYEEMDYASKEANTVREKYMVENFIRELDSLPPDTKIMGIYGSAHVCQDNCWEGNGSSMIVLLKQHYGNIFVTQNISRINSKFLKKRNKKKNKAIFDSEDSD